MCEIYVFNRISQFKMTENFYTFTVEKIENYVLIYMQLEIFIKELSKLFGKRIKKIILYGSYARGDFNKNSDIDLMILTDLDDEELKKYRIKVREIALIQNMIMML